MWKLLFMICLAFLNNIIILIIFKPPVVEPLMAPENIRSKRISDAEVPQRA